MNDKKIILLAGRDQSTNIVFHRLNIKYGIAAAIIEEKEPLNVFLKRRIKRLGIISVLGQIAFQLTVPKLLSFLSKKRKEEIIKKNNLDVSDIPDVIVKNVNSVNSKSTIELIRSLAPDLIIVNGTRIISKTVLQCVDCKFINIHAGMTPMYRGVHGAYWAGVNNDIDNIGVTIHFVDEGIDTGNIIAQKQVVVTSRDNFSTYPLLQLAVGIELLTEAIQKYFNREVTILTGRRESKIYYHPTIWVYLYHRIVRNVK